MNVKPTKGFLRFLKRNKGDRGPVGDLARNLLADSYLPRDVALSLDQIKVHLETRYSVGSEVLATLDVSWELWEREKLERRLVKLAAVSGPLPRA